MTSDTSPSVQSPSATAEVIVNVPQAFAFECFVKQGVWWPKDTHHTGPNVSTDVIIEREAGGRWYEEDAEGNECLWGQVLAFEPVHRLLLSWQLDSQWSYDPNLVTEVEVLFLPLGPEQTRVTLEHRNLDRFGSAEEAVRNALNSPAGWPGLLQTFADEAVKG